MSFSGTPLGQGRRLDHNTFLGKPPSTTHRPPSPHRTSYAYGAPTLGTRSPPKPPPSSITEDLDQPALARFARLKEREQFSSRPGGPKIIASPPHPEKWSVKDTSVNIATAFHQAATDTMQSTNPNGSWASGSQTSITVPRSTSVEYELESQATAARRLAAPTNRLAQSRPPQASRKPLAKAASVRHVPDSEGEEEDSQQSIANGRGKSPFEQVVDIGRRAAFYLRHRSQEPNEPSVEEEQNGKDSSYDYSAEEREVAAAEQQHQQQQQQQRNNANNGSASATASGRRPNHSNATHKRNRMSTDNKAYKPSKLSEDDDDDDFEDDGKTRKKRKGGKKKKELAGGPLTSLPVAGYDKRKKRRPRGSKGNIGEMDDAEDAGSEDEADQSAEQQQRGSVPPEHPGDDSFEPQGLDSIPEHDESMEYGDDDDVESGQPFFSPPPSRYSIGGVLGTLVHWMWRVAFLVLRILSGALFVLGKFLGTLFDIFLHRPSVWVRRSHLLQPVISAVLLGGILAAGWYALQGRIPPFSSSPNPRPAYIAPDVPAADIAEISERLQKIEVVLSGLTLDAQASRVQLDNEVRSHGELVHRLGSLESKVQKESTRAVEAEVQFRNEANMGLNSVKQEVQVLHAQLRAQLAAAERREATNEAGSRNGSDEEARAQLKALEERVGSVEGGVKEALEMGKNSVKAGSATAASNAGAAWWNKLASGSASKSGLTIKSSDGQDVTSLISHLVDSAVSTYGKDTIARADFALHSGGARIIPSLTSDTFETRPRSLRAHLVGLVTGNGYAIGKPPITALHHELHIGHCWPFAGAEGQLGVVLSAPTYISDISIDHVAKEVAFDMRSAPRQMEVWAMVEGRDNIAKVKEWQAEKARVKQEALENGEEVVEEEEEYPKTLPKSPLYIRIASFSYNIHAPNNVQTFPVFKEIQDLELDFGIVVLRIKSNWGQDEFTCLYRMRVHGKRMGEIPLPFPEEDSE